MVPFLDKLDAFIQQPDRMHGSFRVVSELANVFGTLSMLAVALRSIESRELIVSKSTKG